MFTPSNHPHDFPKTQSKVAGAAAAAKKFADAKPKIKEAEDSFLRAKRLLREHDAAKAGANTIGELRELRDRLNVARVRVKEDIEKLKEALEAIT